VPRGALAQGKIIYKIYKKLKKLPPSPIAKGLPSAPKGDQQQEGSDYKNQISMQQPQSISNES